MVYRGIVGLVTACASSDGGGLRPATDEFFVAGAIEACGRICWSVDGRSKCWGLESQPRYVGQRPGMTPERPPGSRTSFSVTSGCRTSLERDDSSAQVARMLQLVAVRSLKAGTDGRRSGSYAHRLADVERKRWRKPRALTFKSYGRE